MSKLEKLVEDLSALTVLEAAELSKLLEEKWGVSAAAPVAMAAAPAAAAAAPAEAVEEQTEFTVVLTGGGDKKINVIKEVRSRPSGPRPEGSQGPGRRRPAERQGKRLQAGSRRDQEEARSRRRLDHGQVSLAGLLSRPGREPSIFPPRASSLFGGERLDTRSSQSRVMIRVRCFREKRVRFTPRGAVSRPPTSAKGRRDAERGTGISSVRRTASGSEAFLLKPPVRSEGGRVDMIDAPGPFLARPREP